MLSEVNTLMHTIVHKLTQDPNNIGLKNDFLFEELPFSGRFADFYVRREGTTAGGCVNVFDG